MPMLVPVVAAVTGLGSSGVIIAGVIGITYASMITYTIVAAAAIIYLSSLNKKQMSDIGTMGDGRMQMTRDTVTSRRVAYGILKLSGPLIYMNTVSDGGSTKNENLYVIIAFASHACAGLDAVFCDDHLVISGSGGGEWLNPEYTNKFDHAFKFGTYDQDAFAIPDPTWTAANPVGSTCMSNICAMYVHMRADSTAYPNGLPTITGIVECKNVLDMDNVNVVSACQNPALNIRDYLLNYYNATADEIDVDSFTTARDICNESVTVQETVTSENLVPGVSYTIVSTGSILNPTDFTLCGAADNNPNTVFTCTSNGIGTGTAFTQYTQPRYTMNYSFTLDTKPSSILSDMLGCCYGTLVYTGGKFVLNVGAYNAPEYTLNENDLKDGLSVTTRSSLANSYNAVTGQYIDGEFYSSSFAVSDFVPVTSSFYIAEDGGNYAPLDLQLNAVTNHSLARRLAKISLMDSRFDTVVTFPGKIGCRRLNAGDTVNLDLPRYGWSQKPFQVIEVMLNGDLSCTLTLKETDPSIYDYAPDEDVTRDLSHQTSLGNAFFVSPPTNFAATETTTKDKDGTVFPSATLTWDAANTGSISNIEIEFTPDISASYDVLGRFSNTITTYTTLDVLAQTTYDFRARNFNNLGVYSQYVSCSLLLNGDTTPPYAPESASLAGGTGSLYVTWVNDPADTDYAKTNIWINTTSDFGSAVTQGSVNGTSWNRTFSSSSMYSVWLQNVNTSRYTSSVACAGSAQVYGVGTGATGPSGSAGNYNQAIYSRSPITPATPTGNLPIVGWSTTIPSDDGAALWVSYGLLSGTTGNLIGTWSVPQVLSGVISYYQSTAPTTGSATLNSGSLWFDSATGYTVYRWSGTAWVSVQDATIPQITASLNSATQSLFNVSSSLNGVITTVTNLSGSVVNLATASLSLSSSLGSVSGAFATSISNIQSTYATDTYALALATSSMNAAVTSSNSYTSGQISGLSAVYATQTSVQSIVTSSINAAVTSSNTYTNGQISGLSSVYATPTYVNSSVSTNIAAAITSSVGSGIIYSAVNTVATATSTLAGNVAAQYVLDVTAGNRIAGFSLFNGSGGSSFVIQSDKFQIVNSSGGQNTVPFLVDGSGVYMDTAIIRSLSAGLISAGTISAAVTMSAGYFTSPTVVGDGIYLDTSIGMRYINDSSVFTITGGSQNGTNHGAQIDLSGTSQASNGGDLVLSAGDPGSDLAGKGELILRTGNAGSISGQEVAVTRLLIAYNGTVTVTHAPSYDSSYSSGAGRLNVEGSLGVGTTASTGNIGQIDATGAVNGASFNSPSTRKLKTNIRDLDSALIRIAKLQPVIFDWKSGKGKDEIGLIAEDVERVIPQVVFKDSENEPQGIDYSKLVPVLIAGMKEQQTIIDGLKKRIDKLEKKNK